MSKKALVLWHSGSNADDFKSAVLKLREEWNSKGTEIFLEHVERLVLGMLITVVNYIYIYIII